MSTCCLNLNLVLGLIDCFFLKNLALYFYKKIGTQLWFTSKLSFHFQVILMTLSSIILPQLLQFSSVILPQPLQLSGEILPQHLQLSSEILQLQFSIVILTEPLQLSSEFQRVHRVNGHSTASMKPNWSRSPCWQMHVLPQVNVW